MDCWLTLYEKPNLNSAKDLFEGLSGIKLDPEMVQLAHPNTSLLHVDPPLGSSTHYVLGAVWF
jgi:hypothetical protein